MGYHDTLSSAEEKEEKALTNGTKTGTTNMGKFVKKGNGSSLMSNVLKCRPIYNRMVMTSQSHKLYKFINVIWSFNALFHQRCHCTHVISFSF